MRYVSLFSGIEAASVAWEPLGWEPLAFSEIEPFPCAVLACRFPDVPNLGDITKIDWSEFSERNGSVDLVCGGSPCQSFSVAGKREGLSGASGLMWEYVRAVRELSPRYFVWENVPGALSSGKGEDFRCLLRAMDELGYGLAWRVLDAQFFGVAQRRLRVFLVGCLGDPERAAEILFEPDGLRWDHPSSRGKRQELAGAAEYSAAPSIDAIAFDTTQITSPQNGNNPQFGDPCHPICAAGHHPTVAYRQPIAFKYSAGAKARTMPTYDDGTTPTLTADWHSPAVAYAIAGNIIDRKPENGGHHLGIEDDGACYTLTDETPMVLYEGVYWTVRRLMPIECERLQGFPDGWTDITYRGKPAADGPRYKALGNSMAVPVMRWIGERIEAAI